jgi:hypothetical protein
VTGDLHGSYKLSGTSGKFMLAWCILFICAEKWNAKSGGALLPVLSKMAGFQ